MVAGRPLIPQCTSGRTEQSGPLVTQPPHFDSRNWGYAKLVDLVTAIELFEVNRLAGQGVQVREKPKGRPARKATPKKAAAKRG